MRQRVAVVDQLRLQIHTAGNQQIRRRRPLPIMQVTRVQILRDDVFVDDFGTGMQVLVISDHHGEHFAVGGAMDAQLFGGRATRGEALHIARCSQHRQCDQRAHDPQQPTFHAALRGRRMVATRPPCGRLARSMLPP
ncbi:hypothetical protein D3C81_1689980 [compost metagenome]